MEDRYKFRGLRKENNKYEKVWLYGNLSILYDDEVYIHPKNPPGYFNHMNLIKLETLGQCTGLKDKNGVLIYEGDVLTAERYLLQEDGKHNYHAVVYWFENSAQFGYEYVCVNPNKGGISNGICEAFEGENDWQILGNIHENPELLRI